MGKKLLFGTLLLFFVVVGVVGEKSGTFYFFHRKNVEIFSPLPDFLTRIKNTQVATLDLWLPKVVAVNASGGEDLAISAKSALVYDLNGDKTLYSKNPKERLPIASLTKIMTAIVALENQKPNNRYVVKKYDLVGENSMGLTEREVVSIEDLLYGLILNSGNDAAETFATNYPPGREKFIEAMNKKAQSLGLMDTHFTNPSGLQGDGAQYSNAHDLLVMTRYALTFPLFQKVSGTYQHVIVYSDTHKYFYLENETNLLTTYPGVKGVKTGYTPEANLCLVTFFDDGETRLIAVLLGSNNRRQDMRHLLDYALVSLGKKPPKYTGPSG